MVLTRLCPASPEQRRDRGEALRQPGAHPQLCWIAVSAGLAEVLAGRTDGRTSVWLLTHVCLLVFAGMERKSTSCHQDILPPVISPSLTPTSQGAFPSRALICGVKCPPT